MSDETYRAEDGKLAPKFPRVKGRLPPQLAQCLACNRHLFQSARTCGFCGADLIALSEKRIKALAKAEAAVARLSALLDRE